MAVKIKSQQDSLNERLGADLVFPINNSFKPTSGINLLLQDIQQLLLTIPGERVNRPDFGCTLRNQIWENMSTAAIHGAASIRDALERFEPRITVTAVTSTSNDNTGLITFNIQFIVNNTDTALNLVFPFRAGTQLSFS
jgi:phage baseplate assembly protein W